MSENFDAYHKWLGIPAKDQPPHHYRLLGLNLWEDDRDVIENAADRAMAHVRAQATGKHSELSQRILNEISRAKVCLLSAERKPQYDKDLRAKMAAAAPTAGGSSAALSAAAHAAAPTQPRTATPVGSAFPTAGALPTAGVARPQAVKPLSAVEGFVAADSAEDEADDAPLPFAKSFGQGEMSAAQKARKQAGNPWIVPGAIGAVVVVGALAAIPFVMPGKPNLDPSVLASTHGSTAGTAGPGTSTSGDSTGPGASATTVATPGGAGTTALPVPTSLPTPLSTAAPTSRPAATSAATSAPTRVFIPPMDGLPATFGDCIQLAGQAQKAGDFELAIRLYTRASEYSTGSPIPYYHRAAAYLRTKQYSSALADYQHFVDSFPIANDIPFRITMLQRMLDDKEGFRRTLTGFFAQPEKLTASVAKQTAIAAAVLQSEAIVPWQQVVDLAKSLTKTEGDRYLPVLGIAQFRQALETRDRELMVEAMANVERGPSNTSWPHRFELLFLAMGYHALGQQSESRQQLQDLSRFTPVDAEREAFPLESLAFRNLSLETQNMINTAPLWAATSPGPMGTDPRPDPGPLPGTQGEVMPGELTPAIVRKPVPDAAAITAATELIKDLFKAEYAAARKPEQKVELAGKLYDQATKTGDDPAAAYVLLEEARDLATAGGDLKIALQAVAKLSDDYDVDGPQLFADALAKLVAAGSKSPEHARAWCDAAQQAIDRAAAVDRYDLGVKIARSANPVARKTGDTEMPKGFVERGKRLDELDKAFKEVSKAKELLEADPANQAAHTAVGKFYALLKHDWPAGLEHLAKGDDLGLKALAEQELNRPSIEDFAVLGDRWMEESEKRSGSEKIALSKRAIYWYTLALPSLVGLPKARVEKILNEQWAAIQTRIKNALKSRRVTPTSLAGNANGGQSFVDSPTDGGLLVGFDLSTGNLGIGNSVVSWIQPIYLTSGGIVRGGQYGYQLRTNTIEARPGYAVGAITVSAGRYIHAITITFMAIDGDRLNPSDSYTTQVFGGGGGVDVRLGGTGAPIIGVAGRSSSAIDALGIVLAQ